MLGLGSLGTPDFSHDLVKLTVKRPHVFWRWRWGGWAEDQKARIPPAQHQGQGWRTYDRQAFTRSTIQLPAFDSCNKGLPFKVWHMVGASA